MTESAATEGDQVAVRYTGKLTDGTVFDSNQDGEPLQFELGKGQVIAGFEQAVSGLGVGEKRTVEVKPEEAYGQRDEELVIPVKAEIFGDQTPSEGIEVALRGRDGTVFNGRVAAIEGETVKVDLNHPLAGETLVFDVELVSVNGA